ncbi:hypothetical protein phytr_12580 [Candidatus Phycorickettsia trachydisci]|uniref:Uncharacterized protein n=1 Tax=Candidatus Phycorickettsia trachydisci TaxID=2115978 RepID=A0A2P1PA66_9RICK|nr:PD-(D/E)XK nuclease family transposase [Candidatus Phycorickettsia trachydisci]AVP88182.1 hypothetical protein phytr_12580 [Candidatus Phycorickettsia trachydisci]
MKRDQDQISNSNIISPSSRQPSKDIHEPIEQKIAANKPPQKVKKQDYEPDVPEIFGDPTYDVTFKMLFGTEHNKDISVSLLNSLLGFTGGKEIGEVQINTNKFYGQKA